MAFRRIDWTTDYYLPDGEAPELAGVLGRAAALVRTVHRWRGLPRRAATETTRRAGIGQMRLMHAEQLLAACQLLGVDEAQLLARFPMLAMPPLPTPRAAAA